MRFRRPCAPRAAARARAVAAAVSVLTSVAMVAAGCGPDGVAVEVIETGAGTPAAGRSPSSVGADIAAASLQVGTQTLTRCGSVGVSWCGTLPVPLDYSHPAGPRITVAYRWYPATAPAGSRSAGGPGAFGASGASGAPGAFGALGAAGTVVPVEGGPGYPSIGSVASGYLPMYGPLLDRWNMLAVDLRGTGQSTPLNCPALQNYAGTASGDGFRAVVEGCGDALNHRWKYSDGSWVHASDLFTSTAAAEDLAAVIAVLELPKIDLYGDSYGSFFAQVFASHFPNLVRSVMLDSTYQIAGLDPWYRSSVESMPADFNQACARSVACALAAPGSSWSRISALASALRQSPISGVVPGPSGTPQLVHMDVIGLVNLINDAAGDPAIYRELDASARALLNAGDPAPLLRLYDQRLAYDEAYFGLPASQYSGALYFAVSCLDYPQLFDMQATNAQRVAELQAAEAKLPAGTFAPFTTDEWLRQDEYTEAFTACTAWPRPTEAQPPVPSGGAQAPVPSGGAQTLLPASVPVLVLGGEFDTWTPPAGVPQVLAQLGGHSRFIELANSTHVVGEGDTACGSRLVRTFVADPQAIDALDASCAPSVAPIHTVGIYPETLSEVPVLQPSLPGSSFSVVAGQLAVAAVDTAGDAVSRYNSIVGSVDHGLHGGLMTANSGGSVLTLHGDELVPGVAVSGTVTLPNSSASSGRVGPPANVVTVDLTVTSAGADPVTLQASWSPAGIAGHVIGAVGGVRFDGITAAP